MSKTLTLVFRNSLGRLVRINIANVKDNIAETDIKTAMDTILSKNVFLLSSGELKEAVSAAIVTSESQEFDLVI